MKAWKIMPLVVILVAVILISISPNQGKSEARAKIEVPEEYKTLANPVTAGESSLIEGKRLYGVYCDTCHGEAGTSREKVTKSFDVQPSPLNNIERYTDGELFYMTSKGVEGTKMLAYEMFLSEEERWHIVNYMRILPTKMSTLDKIRDYFS